MVANNSSIFLQTLIYVMNQSSIQQDTSYNYYYLEIGKDINATKCYGIYGCFQLSPPWTSEARPVSLFPENLEKIEPRYPVYTRNNPDTPHLIDLNDYNAIVSSKIEPLKPIYLIAHGYLEGGGIGWILELTRELLKLEDCSVIVVDWHGGSSPPYTQAVANIRLLGAITAHLLADLAKYTGNLKLDHVHAIGHSLGAHLSGYVGYTLKQQFNLTLGRITGLDPAEPHFAKTKPPVRLDKTAAKFVDIVHTDASQLIKGGFGITERIGHVDYYPNGGNNQPGCKKSMTRYISDQNGSFVKGFRKYIGCDHMRSYEFFTESIHSKCSFISISCPSYQDFENGKCFDCGQKGQKCIKFGYHSKKHYDKMLKRGLIHPQASLIQFFKTAEERPYCRGHYRVTLKISDSEASKTYGGEVGQLYFRMHSTSDGKGPKSNPVPLHSEKFYEPGETYTAVVATEEVKTLKAVEVEWRFNSNIFNPLTWRLLETPKIYIDKITVDALEIQESITVCPKDRKPLNNSVPMLLISSYC